MSSRRRNKGKRNWASTGAAYKETERDEKLEPCPWCGKIPRVHTYALLSTRERRFGVWCDNGNAGACPMTAVETLPFETREEAESAWNMRRK